MAWTRVEVTHCSDWVTGLGSNRARHANIGVGQIGEGGFRALLHEPRLARLPFILEVPGAGDGPDAEQVAVLKRLSAFSASRSPSNPGCAAVVLAWQPPPATHARPTLHQPNCPP